MKENVRKNLITPPHGFSPVPFWFWNDELKKTEIMKQIKDMYSKEIDGFVIHPRMGIPDSLIYMSEEFLECVKYAVEEASHLGMKVFLYDEAMYPSGSAHGQVPAENPEFASKGLKVIETDSFGISLEEGQKIVCTLTAKKTGENSLQYESITETNCTKLPEGHVVLYFVQDFTGGHIRGIHIGEDDWENPPKSSDLLNPCAVDCFIRLTHEKYYNALSEYFGNTIAGIFTDEPCIMGREPKDGMVAWTDGFIELFLNSGLRKADLAALWYDIGENTQSVKSTYAKLVEKRLSETFYKKIYDWCGEHNIALIGHPGESDNIGLLKYFHVPGQDLIFRRVAPEENKGVCGIESTQAKCSSDSARHSGKRRNLNECFACSGKHPNEWTFTFDDMKWMTDWLILRGVNMIIPHAFFYSMNGEKRFGERPPDVGTNNIWWKHYSVYSRYVKRLCWLMTDSVNTAKAAVLCESDRLPHEIVRPLFENQIEFNYLEKELLKDCITENGKIKIAGQEYTCLVVDKICLVNDEVRSLSKNGVKVIVYNPDNKAMPEEIISISKIDAITELLQRTVEITPLQPGLRVSCVKKDGEYFYLLVNEGEESIQGNLSLMCGENAEIFNPWTGEFSAENTIILKRRESVVICAGEKLDIKKVFISEDNMHILREKALCDWNMNGRKTNLGSWTEKKETRDFFGTMKYDTEFELDLNVGEKAVLDLGDVREQAEVVINGYELSVKLWAPFSVDITPHLKKGKNKLSVFVTNSLANKYTEDKQPSGLVGNVKILITQ